MARIGLIDIEPKIYNTALMQISAFHKAAGDCVMWIDPALPLEYELCDELYCSSLFTYTDKSQLPKRTRCGGTGFDLTTTLAFDCEYDYSIYPAMDYSIVWFSRGCERRCKFCVVWEKEGSIRSVIPKPLNPKGKCIVVQDNNFFANPKWQWAIDQLHEYRQPVVMQGVDVRDLDSDKIAALKGLRYGGQIKIAWDNPKEDIGSKIAELVKSIKAWRLMCYVLIGFNSTHAEDMMRVKFLRGLGVSPFVMKYDKDEPYQRAFARWVNLPEVFNSVSWKDYKYRC